MNDLLRVPPHLQTPISAHIHRRFVEQMSGWKSNNEKIDEITVTVNAIREFVKSEKEREAKTLNLERYLALERLTKIAGSLEKEI
jgi:hypothetical protein